jgi:uncharacterized protein
MEIRDPVHGSIHYSNSEVAVLDTPEYQRLRSIKQLGFSEFSFPGATHNRYLHSIGVGHLAVLAFDSIFGAYPFSKNSVKLRLKQAFRLATLLHDVGHGPLSHTTEAVMPRLSELKIKAYGKQEDRQANHEDYTIKYVTESTISETIKSKFSDIDPYHVACLIDKNLPEKDDFFTDMGIDFRPILSQLVSSELDVDRMDYLERDSYFCGTNYGKIDMEWLIQNLTLHLVDNKAYLALNRRALYSFDDFLISRHHMHLMVYFHHKSIIYEEMLNRYLTSKECTFFLPADIQEYTKYNDYKLYEHLAGVKNTWAQRIAARTPYKVLIEMHNVADETRPEILKAEIEKRGVEVIWASSHVRLSKYHSSTEQKTFPMFVVDQYDPWVKPTRVERTTEIFQKYEGTRVIDRLYIAPEHFSEGEKILKELKETL